MFALVAFGAMLNLLKMLVEPRLELLFELLRLFPCEALTPPPPLPHWHSTALLLVFLGPGLIT